MTKYPNYGYYDYNVLCFVRVGIDNVGRLTFPDYDIGRLLLELLDEGDPDGRGGGQDVPHLAEEGGVCGRAGDQEAQQRRGHVQEVGLESNY